MANKSCSGVASPRNVFRAISAALSRTDLSCGETVTSLTASPFGVRLSSSSSFIFSTLTPCSTSTFAKARTGVKHRLNAQRKFIITAALPDLLHSAKWTKKKMIDNLLYLFFSFQKTLETNLKLVSEKLLEYIIKHIFVCTSFKLNS